MELYSIYVRDRGELKEVQVQFSIAGETPDFLMWSFPVKTAENVDQFISIAREAVTNRLLEVINDTPQE